MIILNELKYKDCVMCINAKKISTCNQCEDGEEFQEIEPLGVDEQITLYDRGHGNDY